MDTLIDLVSGVGHGRVVAGPADPTDCELVGNATPLGMEDGDPLPVDPELLTWSMFVGDVIAGHSVTPFLQAAQMAGCNTANGGHMVEAAQDVMADFLLQTDDNRFSEERSGTWSIGRSLATHKRDTARRPQKTVVN